MILKKIFRVSDVSADKQTDKVKQQVYDLILQFVRKYKVHYFPHAKDDADDIASDLYLEFTREKLHRNGEYYSELDRFDPKATGDYSGNKLATYVKRFTISRLIDLERTDKQESHYAEKYNPDEGGEKSLDYLAHALEQAQDENFNPDEFEVTESLLLSARDAFDSMSYEDQQEFIAEYKESRSALNPQFQKLFDDLIKGAKAGSDDPLNAAITEVVGPAKIQEQTTRAGSALRITFPDAEAAKEAKSKISELNDKLAEQSYKYYTFRGTSVYYLKSEE